MLIVGKGYDAVPGVMEVLVAADSGITTPQQLAGKPSARRSRRRSLTAPTPRQRGDAGDPVSPAGRQREPRIGEMETHALARPDGALSSHPVSAILVTEPYIVHAEIQTGAGEVLDSLAEPPANLPLSGYFTSASFPARTRTP